MPSARARLLRRTLWRRDEGALARTDETDHRDVAAERTVWLCDRRCAVPEPRTAKRLCDFLARDPGCQRRRSSYLRTSSGHVSCRVDGWTLIVAGSWYRAANIAFAISWSARRWKSKSAPWQPPCTQAVGANSRMREATATRCATVMPSRVPVKPRIISAHAVRDHEHVTHPTQQRAARSGARRRRCRR